MRELPDSQAGVPRPDRPEGLPADLIDRLRRHRADEHAAPLGTRSAVAAILREGGDGLDVLLMTRAAHPADPWSGQVSLPGGRREPVDPDLVATARRETREEVGIDLERDAELLCCIRPVQVWARGRPIDMDVTPFAFRLEAPTEPRPGPEAAEAWWLPMEVAASGALDHEHVFERNGLVHRRPCWRFEGRTVWGLTHRLLSTLIRLGGA